jgi:membrane associated rhomboid family serine protease
VSTQPTKVSKPLNKRVLPQRPFLSAFLIAGFVALLYVIEAVDQVGFHGGLDNNGIEPREADGLDGILWAPLLHGGWDHLVGNTLPLLVFGFLALAAGLGPFISTTVLIWLVSGAGVWLTSQTGSTTIGASGIAFGWLAFLLVRGIFNRSLGQFAVALVLLFFWGTLLFGVLPLNPGISWQAHLFGAIGGVLGAWLTAKAGRYNAAKVGPVIQQPPGSLAP